ncbi:MAG: MFS transporter [Solirubrobacteraceae bacterium]|nr:MFS transporter [Solirubrobacteraceae bacterium]
MTGDAQPTGRSAMWVMAPVALAAFITSLDNTVINIALPALREDLGLSLSGLQWVVTSYILVFSSLLLVGGRLTDMMGRRRAMLVGFSVFSGASLAAGLAPSGEFLVAARVVQGAGAALILPASLSVIASDLEGEARDLGAGIWTAAIAIALFLGPVVGGAISEYLHWSWIFFLNVPVGAVAMAMVVANVPDPGGRAQGSIFARLDPPGLLLSTLALLAITYALVQGTDEGFGSELIIVAFVVAVVAAVAFMMVESRARYPLVDMSLFRNRVFAGGTAAQVLWGLSINGAFFFTSLYLQDVLDLSPTQAGLVFVPLALTLVLGVAIAPRLVTAYGARMTVTGGMVVIAVGLLPIVVLGSGLPQQILGFVIVGFGSGLTTPLTSAILGVMPEDRAGLGSAVVAVAREISGVLGIAVIGAILSARQASALAEGSPAASAFLDGHQIGLVSAAVLVLIGAAVCAATLPRSRDEEGRERESIAVAPLPVPTGDPVQRAVR